MAGKSVDVSLCREDMLFDHAGIRAGVLDCSPAFPQFGDLGPVSNYVVAFPTSPIALTPVGGRRFVGAPGTAVLMNRGQRVLREEVAPTGDRCCWIGLDDDVAQELIEAGREPPSARTGKLFGAFGIDIPAQTYVEAMRLVHRVKAGLMGSSESAEEAIRLADSVAALAVSGCSPNNRRPTPSQRDRQLQLVAAVRAEVAGETRSPIDVARIARYHGVTPYHLARSFREVTGGTVTGFSRKVRLLLSLDHLEHGETQLSSLAASFGFASHSHYSMWFRRIVGITPSEYRGRRRALRPSGRRKPVIA